MDARFEFDDLDAGDTADDNGNDTNSKSQEKADFEADLSRIILNIKEMAPHTNPRYGRDEIGIGYAFADFFKPIARYNAERKQW